MPEIQFHALPGLGAIRLEGPDALNFLQGQVTADLLHLEPRLSARAAWCSPQGRVIALLHVTQTPTGLIAVLPRDLCAAVVERLRRFVMRSRVTVTALSAETGIAGVRGGEYGSFESDSGVTTLRLSTGRDLLVGPADLLETALAGIEPAPVSDWELDRIRLGEPEVYAATSETWIPQMLNLDLLGAVSFRKGCYPGQEIVARTQNLGRIKRRLFRYGVSGTSLPAPGATLFRAGTKVGEVVRCAEHAGAGELLAVVNLDVAGMALEDESGAVTCSPEPLPYAVPEAETAP